MLRCASGCLVGSGAGCLILWDYREGCKLSSHSWRWGEAVQEKWGACVQCPLSRRFALTVAQPFWDRHEEALGGFPGGAAAAPGWEAMRVQRGA